MHYKLPESATTPLLIKGDAFQEIKLFKGNTFDSILIDFPYLIGFMGLDWIKKASIYSTNIKNSLKIAFVCLNLAVEC